MMTGSNRAPRRLLLLSAAVALFALASRVSAQVDLGPIASQSGAGSIGDVVCPTSESDLTPDTFYGGEVLVGGRTFNLAAGEYVLTQKVTLGCGQIMCIKATRPAGRDNVIIRSAPGLRHFELSCITPAQLGLLGVTLTSSAPAAYNGGVLISMGANAKLSAQSCAFRHMGNISYNYDGELGGAAIVAINAGILNLDTSVFVDNYNGLGEGGAVRVQRAPALTISSCEFTGNSALRGGAVFVGYMTAPWLFNAVTMQGNWGEQYAGALLVKVNTPTGSGTIRAAQFVNNTAYNRLNAALWAGGYGGAVALERAVVSFTEGLILHSNRAARSGGGMDVFTTAASINGVLCAFGNDAPVGAAISIRSIMSGKAMDFQGPVASQQIGASMSPTGSALYLGTADSFKCAGVTTRGVGDYDINGPVCDDASLYGNSSCPSGQYFSGNYEVGMCKCVAPTCSSPTPYTCAAGSVRRPFSDNLENPSQSVCCAENTCGNVDAASAVPVPFACAANSSRRLDSDDLTNPSQDVCCISTTLWIGSVACPGNEVRVTPATFTGISAGRMYVLEAGRYNLPATQAWAAGSACIRSESGRAGDVVVTSPLDARHFELSSADAATPAALGLAHLVLQGAGSASNGGGVLLGAGPNTLAALDVQFTHMGGVAATPGIRAEAGSTVELTGCTLSGLANPGGDGGALSASGSTVTLVSCTLSGNSAGTSGALAAANTLLTVSDSVFEHNAATAGIGGAITTASLAPGSSLSALTLTNNSAATDGGALWCSDSALGLTGSTMTGNVASRSGGAVYATNCVITATGRTVLVGNSAPSSGGGALAIAGGSFNMAGPIASQTMGANSAPSLVLSSSGTLACGGTDRGRTDGAYHVEGKVCANSCVADCPCAHGFDPVTGDCVVVHATPTTCPGAPTVAVTNGHFEPSCANMAVGQSCIAHCQPGYESTPPQVACTESGWATTATPAACEPVCGTPDASLLSNGVFNCQGPHTPVGGVCTGTCAAGWVGAPRITCGPSGHWMPETLVGTCSRAPMCVGLPSPSPSISVSQAWPHECEDMGVGRCQTNCSVGYSHITEAARPTVVCRANASSPTGASWDSIATGSCQKVCVTQPSNSLLNGTGVFADCAGRVPVAGRCTAKCNDGYFGSPWVYCASGFWSPWNHDHLVVGNCLPGPTCLGNPTAAPLNAAWHPTNYYDSAVGTVAIATCNTGYKPGANGPPRVMCVASATAASHAAWQPAVLTGTCIKAR